MLKTKIISLLLEDSEGKKVYEARFNLKCKGCSDEIRQGDPLYFYGSYKVCQKCFYEVLDYLQEMVKK